MSYYIRWASPRENNKFDIRVWDFFVFRSNDPKYYTTSAWLAPEQKEKWHTGRALLFEIRSVRFHCVPIRWSEILYYLRLACHRNQWKITYRETTVFGNRHPKYYTTSDWLAPEINGKWHTGRPLCLGNAIQGDHCVWETPSKILYYLRLACPRNQWKMTYRETTAFGKHHTGRPLCLDPMIQTMFSMLLKTFPEHILIRFQSKKWWIPWRFWWACIMLFCLIPWSTILYYLRLACPGKNISNMPYRKTTVLGKHHTGWPLCDCVPIPMSKLLYYLRLVCPGKNIENMPYRETTVFGKRHTGRPLYSDPMIQNIILPQIGLPQDKYLRNAIQGDHCVWETPYRDTTVCRSHDQKYYTTSDWLAPEKHNENMPYRETTVFGKRHTGRPTYSDPMIKHIILHQIGLPQEIYFKHAIQGDHCVWETTYRETTVCRSNDPKNTRKPLVLYCFAHYWHKSLIFTGAIL